MASCLDLDISCPVCLEVFKNPVVLSCSHSFCKVCVQNWWTEKVTLECPVCKRRSSRSDPPCNLVLKNLCEAFSQELTLRDTSVQSEPLCPQHKEKLLLFCRDHQQPVCLVCRDSRAHHNHRFSPIDEAVQEYKELLRERLGPLQDRLEAFSQVEVFWDGTAEHIKHQGQHTERMIQREFDKMRDFLQKEEQTRIRALRTEVQQKKQQIEKSRAALREKKASLSETVQVTETHLTHDGIPFLQNYEATVKKVSESCLTLDPLPSGSLVDVVKHLGNLSFNIWNKMKELVSYTPVVLDPNTAHPYLVVSDDLQRAQYTKSDTALYIDSPDRFNSHLMVQGSEGFTSGTHSWQVDIEGEANVSDDAGWAVGVVSDSAPRNEEITSGSWEIWLKNGQYTAYAPPLVDKVLNCFTLIRPLRRIRVDLDYRGGKLAFSDPKTNMHIYTFRHVFNQRLFPFVSTSERHRVRILPLDITLQLQKDCPHVSSFVS